MGRAEKEWAKRKRQELMALLGNVCAHCGTDENLEFDCISPRGHKHHRGDASRRGSEDESEDGSQVSGTTHGGRFCRKRFTNRTSPITQPSAAPR